MAAKELVTQVKLQVPAGSANPAPPVGPALGQHGLNIQDFCKQFNDRTKDNEKGLALPVIINVYKDRSFDFVIKSTPASILLKKAAGIQKGSPTPQSNKVGKVTMKRQIQYDCLRKVHQFRQKELPKKSSNLRNDPQINSCSF